MIERGANVETDRFPKSTTVTVTQLLQEMGEIMVDLQGYILWVEEPYQSNHKETGEPFTKQMVYVVDPIEKFGIKITFWNNFIPKELEGCLCKFYGFKLKFFKGTRQVSTTVYSNVSQIKGLKVDLKELRQFEFTSLSESYKHRTLPNLESELLESGEGEYLYTKTTVTIKENITESPFYMGCPHCHTKVEEDLCTKCSKKVIPVSRLILQYVMEDEEGAVNVALFERMSEQLLSLGGLDLTKEKLFGMNVEESRRELNKVVGMRVKMGLGSSVGQYQGERYLKHTVL